MMGNVTPTGASKGAATAVTKPNVKVTPMFLGYCRVSKSDGSQVLDLQRDALVAAGVDPDQMYSDQASGKVDDRPGLISVLKALRQGDTLIV